ncbi:urea ABC transporter ATP-binding protein UrtD [Paenibacillus sp.]|uniref:urea ABC transporter ATP-binding protein UrtD n=1 Tax=Paenibacillus sp. TaxID=58172 RepID=UPI002D716D6E|nr:urea ABC transporter ATP-binding protein UrtD [Paenibacillus sp.]HZG87176.1 urea ABC transporter ATP-binding protein UrtD [Paenibacillus sp.]
MEEQAIVLSCRKVSVSFDGFYALREMDFTLRRGELRFLIGPNGAGKTTMLDAICGKVKPKSGSVTFFRDGAATELTKLKEHSIAACGIGRKFQAPSVFSALTVRANMEIALKQKRTVFALLFAKMDEGAERRIRDTLAMVGLLEKAEWKAGALSHGEKQWLEIGMILLSEPQVMLLDEPVAGMTDEETEKTGHLLRRIIEDRSVVVVEHDMDFVRRFSSKVTVMHEGSLLTEGTMAEVQSDEKVAEVYLGKIAG